MGSGDSGSNPPDRLASLTADLVLAGSGLPSLAPRPRVRLGTIGPYRLVCPYPSRDGRECYVGEKTSSVGIVTDAIVKLARASAPNYARERDLILCEGRALAAIHHPNIVRLIDVEQTPEGSYLATECVRGTNLQNVNEVLRDRGQALPLELAVFTAVGLLRALQHVHAAADADGHPLGIVHRDVKPDGVLLTKSGHIQITDFGWARLAGDSISDPNLSLRSLAYVAPEVMRGEPSSAPSDVYSAAVVLLELFLGRPLFGTQGVTEIRRMVASGDLPMHKMALEGVPAALGAVVERGAALDQKARYASAGEMANALEVWLKQSELYVSPWILAAFLKQHDLYAHPVSETSSPMDRERTQRTGAPPAAMPSLEAILPLTPQPTESPLQIEVDDSEWTRPAPQRAITPKRGPHLQTELTQDDARSILHRLGAQGATGVVKFTKGPIWKAVHIRAGLPVMIESNVGMELFGEQLVRAGLVTTEDIEKTMREVTSFGRSMTQRLLERGLVDRDVLAEQLGMNILNRLEDVLQWRDGHASFRSGAVASPHVLPDIDMAAI